MNLPNFLYSYVNNITVMLIGLKTQEQSSPTFLPPQQMSTFILCLSGPRRRAYEMFLSVIRVDMILWSGNLGFKVLLVITELS